jgi:hypothetical protein
MRASRSNEYYYSTGNVIIQVRSEVLGLFSHLHRYGRLLKVETCLYRLHRDILGAYSGFFRDMFSTPSSDVTEGSFDEYPLTLPQDLCSDAIFGTLCQFIYPKCDFYDPHDHPT